MSFKSKFFCRLLLCFTFSITNTIVTCESNKLSSLLDMQNFQPVRKDLDTRATLRTCGGILQTDEVGDIIFNPLSPLGINVSCLWIIHVPGSSIIHLNVTESYFAPGEEDVFQYGYFNNSNYHNKEDFVWESFGKVSPDTRTVKGPIVFIHLATYGRSPSLGFNLMYKANRTSQINHLYVNQHTIGDHGAIKFSPESLATNASLRYIYVIQPPVTSPSTQNLKESLYFLRMKLLDEPDNCVGNETDIISVYRWESSWNKVQGHCGSQSKTQPRILFSTKEGRNDPLIITFKSDSKIRTQSKFEFFWNYHSGSAAFVSTFYKPLLLLSTVISTFTKLSN